MSEPTTTLNQETAKRTAAGPATQVAAPATPAVTATAKDSAEGRKLLRNLVALLIVSGAVFLTLYVWMYWRGIHAPMTRLRAPTSSESFRVSAARSSTSLFRTTS